LYFPYQVAILTMILACIEVIFYFEHHVNYLFVYVMSTYTFTAYNLDNEDLKKFRLIK